MILMLATCFSSKRYQSTFSKTFYNYDCGQGGRFRTHLIGLVYDILTKNIYSLLNLRLTRKDIFFCFSCQRFKTVHNQQRVSESYHFLSIFLYVRPDHVLIFTLLQNFFYITNIFVIAGTNKMFQKWQNIIQFCMKFSHCHRNIVTCMFWVRKKVTHEEVKIGSPP